MTHTNPHEKKFSDKQVSYFFEFWKKDKLTSLLSLQVSPDQMSVDNISRRLNLHKLDERPSSK
jgi:hypothetical protein